VIYTTALSPAERFDRIMRSVGEALAAQHKEGRLFGPLLILTWTRLRQAGMKVLALAAAYAAGTLPWRPRPPRRYRPRPQTPPQAAPAATPPAAEKPKLPSGFGWLIGRARVAFGRSQLSHLLADPDMQDMIAAIPQMAHHLRPVCRMLGVRPPPGLFPPRRRPRRPPPETPAPESPARQPEAAVATPSPPPDLGPVPQPLAGIYVPPPPRFGKRWLPPGRRARFKPA
jgi:hypothetical protein